MNKEDLKAKVISALRRLPKLKGAIRGFFRLPHCGYVGDVKSPA